MSTEVNEQPVMGPPAWAMPLAAIATVVGLAALFAGLFAFASGADTSRLTAESPSDLSLDTPDDSDSDAQAGQGPGTEPSSPFDQAQDGESDGPGEAPGQGVGQAGTGQATGPGDDQGQEDPGQGQGDGQGGQGDGQGQGDGRAGQAEDGQVLSPSAIRDLIQQQLDESDEVSFGTGGQQVDVTRHGNGVIELRGPSGNPLFIAPDGVPGASASPDQTGNLLVPSPDGQFSGVRVDSNGDVVPVPIGEETADTLRFGFGQEGARSLSLPGTGESLRVTPEGRDALGGPVPEFGPDSADAAGGAGLGRPDVRRDAIQSELDGDGSTTFSIDGQGVTVTRLPNGALQLTGPNGESLILLPDGVADGAALGAGDPGSGVFAPSPDGEYSGVRVDENGKLVPVEKGQETDDTLLFGFGPESVRELFLPEAEGEALRISPDGQTSIEPPPGVESSSQDQGQSQPESQSQGESESESPVEGQSESAQADDAADEDSGDGINWRPILIALGVAALVIAAVSAAIYFANRRREPPEPALDVHGDQGDAYLINAVASMSDQIEAEPDPRMSILRAYAQVESGFASDRLIRQRSESPKQFLERAFGDTRGVHGPLSRLTALFELARFSDYPITPAMRDDALLALQQIRVAFTASGAGPTPVGPPPLSDPPPPDPSTLVAR